MKRYLILPAFLFLFGCANQQHDAEGAQCDQGYDLEHAIILDGPKTETEGVTAEHAFVKSYYPGWVWTSQDLLQDSQKSFDAIHLEKGNQKKVIYFDISAWFGHW